MRTVERDEALGIIARDCWAAMDCWTEEGRSCESRSAKERSASSVPFTAGSPPVKTTAFESS